MDPRILLVTPAERRQKLLSILSSEGMEVLTAGGVAEAETRLSDARKYDVVFVDAELPDGDWRDVLQFVAVHRETAREVVVCARCGDEQLWAEVIQCGAFDLVPEPFERQEVLRIARSAADSHYLDRFHHGAAARAF
jgi:DNA-binding NtrC family response regulator